jgi:hypothetical protein
MKKTLNESLEDGKPLIFISMAPDGHAPLAIVIFQLITMRTFCFSIRSICGRDRPHSEHVF